eukprot:scaffold253626_cov36-Tisochrysis_lutea.AAC.2
MIWTALEYSLQRIRACDTVDGVSRIQWQNTRPTPRFRCCQPSPNAWRRTLTAACLMDSFVRDALGSDGIAESGITRPARLASPCR